jgi:hypothetical protein
MKKSPAGAGYVYAIQSPESLRHVKIGLSINPKSRLKQLQTGNPNKLKLIWAVPCPNMAELEGTFHQMFNESRIAGSEWFVLAPFSDPEHAAALLTVLAFIYFVRTASPEMRRQLAAIDESLTAFAMHL